MTFRSLEPELSSKSKSSSNDSEKLPIKKQNRAQTTKELDEWMEYVSETGICGYVFQIEKHSVSIPVSFLLILNWYAIINLRKMIVAETIMLVYIQQFFSPTVRGFW